MKVYLTFDVEVWCNGWHDLDARFPGSFDRYCYGRSAAGDFALPKTLEILNRYGLQGVFFVEPLFSARFGSRYLDTMVTLIRDAGHDVQLHLHPEWTDEIRPPLLGDVSKKRQHLTYYDVDEQTALIRVGRQLLEASKGAPVTAFRAGSFAANMDTYRALRRNGLSIDSSLNPTYDHTGGTIPAITSGNSHLLIEGVQCFPITVFRDGFGRQRAVLINGCSLGELRSALLQALGQGTQHFVLVSHNFEMLKPGSTEPDRWVVRRFEGLCDFLASNRYQFQVGSFTADAVAAPDRAVLNAGLWDSTRRLLEQAARRLG